MFLCRFWINSSGSGDLHLIGRSSTSVGGKDVGDSDGTSTAATVFAFDLEVRGVAFGLEVSDIEDVFGLGALVANDILRGLVPTTESIMLFTA